MESEKTAVICAGLMPRFLWLATGGKQAINDRLLVLRGRKVLAFPDIDGYDEWQRKLAEVVWQKSRLLQEFGAQWFVEVEGY